MNKLIYFGKYLNLKNNIIHYYYEINSKNELLEKWVFSKKIFKKGQIGSVYNCKFEDKNVVYNQNEIPTSLLKTELNTFTDTFILFPKLHEAEEKSRQIDIKIRNSKKQKNEFDIQIHKIKEIYKSLPPQKRVFFISNIVYKITS